MNTDLSQLRAEDVLSGVREPAFKGSKAHFRKIMDSQTRPGWHEGYDFEADWKEWMTPPPDFFSYLSGGANYFFTETVGVGFIFRSDL